MPNNKFHQNLMNTANEQTNSSGFGQYDEDDGENDEFDFSKGGTVKAPANYVAASAPSIPSFRGSQRAFREEEVDTNALLGGVGGEDDEDDDSFVPPAPSVSRLSKIAQSVMSEDITTEQEEEKEAGKEQNDALNQPAMTSAFGLQMPDLSQMNLQNQNEDDNNDAEPVDLSDVDDEKENDQKETVKEEVKQKKPETRTVKKPNKKAEKIIEEQIKEDEDNASFNDQAESTTSVDADGDEIDENGLPILPKMPTKKPGKPSVQYLEAKENYDRIKAKRTRILNARKLDKAVSDETPEIDETEFSAFDITGDEYVAGVVLKYVCESVVENLKQTYKSNMFTKEYMDNLFQGYIDGQINSENPLFKSLIKECINNAEEDPYVKDITKLILTYISEH